MSAAASGVSKRRAIDEKSVLQVGDAFALEVLTPGDKWHVDEQRLHKNANVVGFVGARKSDRSCFCDFTTKRSSENADAVGSGRPPNPELCRFVLTTPNQYAASKAMHRWAERSAGTHDEGEALKRDADKEMLGNRALRRSQRGKPALFGGVFQLEHSAGEYLDLKKQIALEDPAALQASLAPPDKRTKHTWFRIIPGFRTRKEGELIRYGDTVMIQSMKKSSQLFLHVGKDRERSTNLGTELMDQERRVNGHEDTFAPNTDCRVELNVSPIQNVENQWRSQFRIVPVAKYTTLPEDEHDTSERNDYIARGGDYLEIFHRQSQAYLSVDCRDWHLFPSPRLFRPLADSKDQDPQPTISAQLVWKIMIPKMAWCGNPLDAVGDIGYCLNAAMMSGEELFLAENAQTGQVTLSADPENRLSQWLLVPFDKDMVGAEAGLRYDESKFYLKNMQSGRVLHQGNELQKLPHESLHKESAHFELQMLDPSADHESDVFVLHPLGAGAAARQWLAEFQAGEEGLDGLWRFHHDIEKIVATRKCLAAKDERSETNLMHHLSKRLQLHQRQAAVKQLRAERHGVDVEEALRALWARYVHPPVHHWNEWAGPALNDLRCFIGSLVTGTGDDPLKWMGTPDKQQQSIFHGLGVVQFVVNLLQAIYELLGQDEVEHLHDANRRDTSDSEGVPWGEQDDAEYRPKSPGRDRYVLLLVRACFHLLHCMVKDNSACAVDLFRNQEFLFQAIGMGFGVTSVVADMFDGTPELLQSKELTRFIGEFWKSTITLRRARFPTFLAQICFDEKGSPLDSNQNDVVQVIKKELPDDVFNETPCSEPGLVVSENPRAADTRKFLFNRGMIELAAATCAGHMQEAMQLWLEDVPQFDFSYTHILSKIADPNAHVGGYRGKESWDVRGVYLRAMRNMYVDRQQSNMQKQTRQRTRIWPGLNVRGPPPADDISESVGPAPTPGFTDLKTVLNKSLTGLAGDLNAADIEKNTFVLEVLGLVQFMIRQGYYDPRADDPDAMDDGVLLLGPELQTLVPLLVALLDGRGDLGHIGRREKEHMDMLELEQLAKPGSRARFALNNHNLVVMSLKAKSLEILNDLFEIQASSRVHYALQELCSQVNGVEQSIPDASQANGKQAASAEATEEQSMDNPLHIPSQSAATFEVEDSSPTAANGSTQKREAQPDSVASSGTEDKAKLIDPKSVVAAQRAATSALKADDKFQKGNKLLSGKTDDKAVTAILLDGLRYSHKTELVLSSFAALYNFRAEGQMYHQFLTEVSLLATKEEAEMYLTLHQLVTSYQRSVQRLLEEACVRRCIQLAGAMAGYCVQKGSQQAATARLLLRNLEIDKHLATMMETHPNDVHEGSYFMLLQSTLDLLAALCFDDDPAGQSVFAGYLDSTIMPLFAGGPVGGDPELTHVERQNVMLLVAGVLPNMFSGNRRLAITFAAKLVSKTVEAIRVFGKHQRLLETLHVLVQVNGKSVEYAQTQVSKGIIEKSARVLDCALDKNEWEEGPSMSQNDVLIHAMRGDVNRAQKELSYYCAMLELMGLCARGLMPHTELQAASMLSFDRVVIRINNTFMHPGLKQFQHLDQLTEVKRTTVLFLNDVYIDSDSEFVQTVTTEKMNGLWTVPDMQSHVRKPVAELFCDDMESLDAHSSEKFRSYVMTELCDFFILYAVGCPRQDLRRKNAANIDLETKDEDARVAYMRRAIDVASTLLTSTEALRCKLRDDEISVLQHMRAVLEEWMTSEGLPPQISESLRRAGANLPERKPYAPPATLATTTWNTYINQIDAKFGVEMKSSPDASAKLLDVARDLVLDVPDEFSEDARFSGSLFKAIDSRIEAVTTIQLSEMDTREIDVICSVLDIIRAVPFTVHGDETGLKPNRILELYLAEDNSIFDNPSIATSESQILLVKEGWGLLCWKILSVPHLRRMHLAAARLLSVLVGGGNYDVQTSLHEELSSKNKCVRELLGSSCRRIFDRACDEFRLLRKKKHGSPGENTFQVASRTLDVLCSSCKFLHRGFQDYIPNQKGHEETYLLIPDIYDMVVEMERELSEAIAERSQGLTLPGANDTEDEETRSTERPFEQYSDIPIIDMFESAIRLLINLVSGPHKANALMVASSGIFMALSRILKYAKIESLDDIKHLPKDDPSPSRTESHWQNRSLWRCRLCSYTTELLLALLEGQPDTQVVTGMIQTLDFQTWAHHMRILKSIIEGRTSFGVVPQVLSECAWVNAQSFAMMTIIEKLISVDQPRSAVVPLMAVLKQKPLLEFFRSRVGHALVIREGKVESLYFDLALLPREMTDFQTVAGQLFWQDVTDLLYKAYIEHGGDIGRLSVFLEGVIEHIWQIDRNIEIAPHVDRAKDFANNTVIKRILTVVNLLNGKWTLLALSLVLNLTMLLALKPSDDGADMYGRWSPGGTIVSYVSRFHLLYSGLNMVHFVFVRNPVLAKVHNRKKMIHAMAQKSVNSGTLATFADFITCTVHIKDLPRGITEAQIRAILEVYGEIQIVQIWGSTSRASEALVSFLQEDSVDRVSEARVEAPASLWKQHRYLDRVNQAVVGVNQAARSRLFSSSAARTSAEARRLIVVETITLERARRSTGTFSEQLDMAARKYLEGDDQGLNVVQQMKDAFVRGRSIVAKFQAALDVMISSLRGSEKGFADDDCGFVLSTSKELTFSFRRNPEFYNVSADLFFSILGYFQSNLWFAYHLLHAFKMHGAKIVLKSLTRNLSRLVLTILLALVAVYIMAIFGYTMIREDHLTGSSDDVEVGNPGGACANLLTCFISYAFAGFTQTGLIYWLDDPIFPEGNIPENFWAEPGALFGGHGTRLIFEMLFMVIITTVVVAIITGIIVDTFSELRAQQENALTYRKTICFVTGVSFMNVPEQKSTSYMQYAFLLAFLRRKSHKAARPLTPLERHVATLVDQGDTSWVPSVGNLLSDQEQDPQALSLQSAPDATEHAKSTKSDQRLAALEAKLSDLLELFEASTGLGAATTVAMDGDGESGQENFQDGSEDV